MDAWTKASIIAYWDVSLVWALQYFLIYLGLAITIAGLMPTTQVPAIPAVRDESRVLIVFII